MPIYMHMDGITGNATKEGYENWTDIATLSHNAHRSINTDVGSANNRESAEPVLGEFVLNKVADISSPNIFIEAVNGSTGKTVQIELMTTGDKGQTYLKYVLTNALISSYELSHNSADGSRPIETLTINYTKIEMIYTPTDAENVTQQKVAVAYDLATTKAA